MARAALRGLSAPCWTIICAVFGGIVALGAVMMISMNNIAKEPVKFKTIKAASCPATDFDFRYTESAGEISFSRHSTAACPALADPMVSVTNVCPVPIAKATPSSPEPDCNVSSLAQFWQQRCAPILSGHAVADCENSPLTCVGGQSPRQCRTACEKAAAVIKTECFFLDAPGAESAPYFHPAVAKQTLRYLAGKVVGHLGEPHYSSRCSYSTFGDLVLNNCDTLGCNSVPSADNYNPSATIDEPARCSTAACPATIPDLPFDLIQTTPCATTGHGATCGVQCAPGFENLFPNGTAYDDVDMVSAGSWDSSCPTCAAEAGTFRCNVDSDWDFSGRKTCTPTQCTGGLTIPNSPSVVSGVTGSTFEYTCNQGYDVGAAHTCVPDSNVSGSPASFTGGSCIAQACEAYDPPGATSATCNGATTDDCAFTCASDKIHMGTLTCQVDNNFRGGECSSTACSPSPSGDADLCFIGKDYCEGTGVARRCCGAMTTTQAPGNRGPHFAFDGVFTENDINYYEINNAVFRVWHSALGNLAAIGATTPAYLMYDFGQNHEVYACSYKLTGAATNPALSPMIWKMEAACPLGNCETGESTNTLGPAYEGGSLTWVEIGSEDESSNPWTEPCETRSYSLATTTSSGMYTKYRYFRMKITDVLFTPDYGVEVTELAIMPVSKLTLTYNTVNYHDIVDDKEAFVAAVQVQMNSLLGANSTQILDSCNPCEDIDQLHWEGALGEARATKVEMLLIGASSGSAAAAQVALLESAAAPNSTFVHAGGSELNYTVTQGSPATSDYTSDQPVFEYSNAEWNW